ncbi:hypothetical protein CU098_003436 [Rhizopus stolonifer]|uniref:Uncharacterized protein n=1 Tax=Rhizopus stolonifer TaxID=4846 RepID=A0A367ITJ3_RHIST|nr:hypothetical protein CU098_003436 [Rhizopus stolonifer]
MRPDEYKAKESRKYQARKKQQGDSTASEVARQRAEKSRDKGMGIASIRRRNGEEKEETEQEKEEKRANQAKFSRRKMVSNYDRYEEETEQGINRLERDAELGIDRETTDLVSMLENTDEGSSTFFKFKDEQLFGGEQKQANAQQLLGLSDSQLVEDALNYQPVVLDKPMVPAFAKNAKGFIVHNKSQQQPTRNTLSEVDGIYLRNDGSNHKAIPTTNNKPANSTLNTTIEKNPKGDQVVDDLDELLAIKDTPVKKIALPKPGSIKKKPTVNEDNKDDEAWLDDLLDE